MECLAVRNRVLVAASDLLGTRAFTNCRHCVSYYQRTCAKNECGHSASGSPYQPYQPAYFDANWHGYRAFNNECLYRFVSIVLDSWNERQPK